MHFFFFFFFFEEALFGQTTARSPTLFDHFSPEESVYPLLLCVSFK